MTYTAKECKQWYQNKLINPKTGRKIQLNKGTYNKIKAACEHYNLDITTKRTKKRPVSKKSSSGDILDNWTYTKYIGSGATGLVFAGKFNGEVAILKYSCRDFHIAEILS